MASSWALPKSSILKSPLVQLKSCFVAGAVLRGPSTDVGVCRGRHGLDQEDAVKEEAVKPVATATNTEVGAGGAQKAPATKHDLSLEPRETSRSHFSGGLRLDATYNSARIQGPGMPAFLFPKFAGGFSQHNIRY